MSYEERRMAIKFSERRGNFGPEASDPLAQALAARYSVQSKPAPRPTSVATAPAPVAPPASGKPWAQTFFEEAASSGLPLTTLNAIVKVCGSHAEASAKVAARRAGGPAASPASKGDAAAAARISAAHAKAHQLRCKTSP